MYEVEDHLAVTQARARVKLAKDGLAKAEQAVARASQTREAAHRGAARAIASGKKPQRLDNLPDPVALAAAVDEHRQAIQLAEQDVRESIVAAKADMLAELQTQHVAAVEDLSKKLRAATEANTKVRQIEERAGQLRVNGHDGLPRLSWPELGEESTTRASKISTWLRAVETYLPVRKRKRLTKRAA